MLLSFVQRAQRMAEHHTGAPTTMSGQWSALHTDIATSSRLEVDMLISIK